MLGQSIQGTEATRVDLIRTHPAIEKCSDKGCLPMSLLELLSFNMTFVFIASVLVLIEVSVSEKHY